jgi:uncharacterized protein (DUF433 family)
MPTTTLDREVFTLPEAARHAEVPMSTLSWWLEGRSQGGRFYDPVLRPRPTGSNRVTWGEFVEARYLRAYRRRGVALQRLRPFIERMRQEFAVAYPLAHFKPFVDEGMRLVLRLQQLSGVPDELGMVVEASSGQILLTPASSAFLAEVEFAGEADQAARLIRPDGRESQVVIDPDYSSGAPTIRGIRTEALAELIDAGEPIVAVAADFNLDAALLRQALAYEWRRAA